MPPAPEPTGLEDLIRRKADEHSVHLRSGALPCLSRHLAMMLRWTPAAHLTSIVEPEEAVVRHVLESAVAARFVAAERGPLLDVGSGNGYPGLAIKCLLPALRVILLEPALRKSVFLKQVATALEMKSVEIHRKRLAEPRDVLNLGPFGAITMRGVRALAPVLEVAGLALSPGGRLILYLARSKERELAGAVRRPLRLQHSEALPCRQRSRLVVIERSG